MKIDIEDIVGPLRAQYVAMEARALKAEAALRGIIALVENARPDYALLADIKLRAIIALSDEKGPATTEELDTAQFGQVLHDRPLDKQEGK